MPGSQTLPLEPNSLAAGYAQTVTNTGGAPNTWTAVSDNTDATYLAGPGVWAFGLDNSGLADSAIIQSVGIRIRFEQTAGAVDSGPIFLIDPVTGKSASFHYSITAAVPTTQTGPLFTSLAGQKLTRAVIDRMIITGSVHTGTRLYQIFVDVNYNAAPTATFTTPTGSSTIGIANPTVGWTYADPEGDPQARYELIVWEQKQLAAILNFNALGVDFDDALMFRFFPPRYWSDKVSSSAPSALVTSPLLNNRQYVFFLRVNDQGAGSRWSDWVRIEHVLVSVPVPAVPKITASAYDALRGRVPLSIQGFDNKLTDNQAGAENATSDYTLSNCTAILDTTSSKLWSPPDGPTISTKSLKITASSATQMYAVVPNAAAIGVPVSAGKMYLAGAHVFSTTARTCAAQIQFYDASNAVVGTTLGRSIPTARGISPAVPFVVATAPAGAVRAILYVIINSPANGESHWIDDFFINATIPSASAVCGTWPGNIVSNTSFETWAGSTSDWNLVTNGAGQTIGFTIGSPPDGTQSLSINKAETALAPCYAEWPDLGNSVPRLPVTAGDVLIVTGMALAASGAGVTVEVVYQDGTHHEVTCSALSLGEWEPFLAAVQIPSGKTSCSVRFLPVAVGANGSAGQVFIDAINVAFATAAQVTAFVAAGGASGTPVAGSRGNSTLVNHLFLGQQFVPFYPWVRGGLTATETYDVQRSLDGGEVWADVRGNPTLSASRLFDYEATPNSTVMYRARTNAIDPDNAASVTSDWSDPLIGDPGFEQQAWSGMDLTDPYSLNFQPPFGATVGALTGPTGSGQGQFLQSPVFELPMWGAAIKVRFLARLVNAQGVVVSFNFLDALGNPVYAINALTLPTSAGDSGWAWYETAFSSVLPMTPQMFVGMLGQSAVDGAQPLLAAFDSMTFVVEDSAGAVSVITIPDRCAQWLKDPLNPGGNMMVEAEIINVGGSGNASAQGIESTSIEPQLILQPSGRSTPVILADVISAETFPALQFILANDAEWAAFETLRKAQRTLLLQLPYGDLVGEQHYVRLGDVRTVGRITSQDQARNQRRRVILPAREVDVP